MSDQEEEINEFFSNTISPKDAITENLRLLNISDVDNNSFSNLSISVREKIVQALISDIYSNIQSLLENDIEESLEFEKHIVQNLSTISLHLTKFSHLKRENIDKRPFSPLSNFLN